MTTTLKIQASSGRPYGHVPGKNYLDCDIVVERRLATLTITWGSAQGYDEEHGREEYSRTGRTMLEAIENVREAALAEQVGESRRYVEAACSRAMLEALDPNAPDLTDNA